MIGTKKLRAEIAGYLRLELDGIQGEVRHLHDVAMSAAAASKRDVVEGIDRIVPALGQAYTSIDRLQHENTRLKEAMGNHARRVDHVLHMLMEYLDVEIVHEPERTIAEDGYLVDVQPAQDYIAKRPKGKR